MSSISLEMKEIKQAARLGLPNLSIELGLKGINYTFMQAEERFHPCDKLSADATID